jgi:hypothetical protein
MKISLPTRRIAATILAPALTAGALLAAPAAQADQPEPNFAETAAVNWLLDQPKISGVFHSYYGPTRAESFIDYGLNLDLVIALKAYDPTNTAKIYNAVLAGAADYTDAYGTRYAGATGKLAAMIDANGGDPTQDVAGRDLIEQLEELTQPSGRALDMDIATGGVAEYETSNTIGQTWVVRALNAAESAEASAAADYLLKQQCADGSFRLIMADAQCTTGTGAVDTTTFAVDALTALGGQQENITRAVNWLKSKQSNDGSFIDEGAANANSTGLATQILAAHGHDAAAALGAGWILGQQLPSGDEEGAIAATVADRGIGTKPIARLDRDRYVRATVQALGALASLAPAATLNVTAPSGFIQSGKTIKVSATGLAAGEAFRVILAGKTIAYGTANGSGNASASVKVTGTTGRKTVTIQGTNAKRAGSGTITLLAAKKFSISLKSKVKKNAKQKATVSGLVSGEKVTVYVGGKKVKTAKANSKGKYAYSFKVGKKAGKKTIKFTGAFSNRTASKSFKVA